MNKRELVETIRATFTPLVFLCECKGAHANCARVLESANVWAQRDTVERICAFIERELLDGS